MDKYNLERFVKAQEQTYEQALQEIRNGRKQGDWIWYIFPQVKGLGHSDMSDYYGIGSWGEAYLYPLHSVLDERLREITEALLAHEKGKHIEEIFTPHDAMKVRSSMTLFDQVCPNNVFRQVLEKYYDGEEDQLTLEIMEQFPVSASAKRVVLNVDPVEHTPEYKAIEDQVEREIQEILDEEDRDFIEEHGYRPKRGMGFCHHYWAIKREVLARHGIEWRSMAEMNKRVLFD